MDSDIPQRSTPPVTEPAPAAAAPPVAAPEPQPAHRETAHERHTREFEQSLEVIEDTVEHGLVRVAKIAVPLLLAFVASAVGLYILGGKMRDRSEARRVARAMRRASRGQTSS